jgi:hypothetical protein
LIPLVQDVPVPVLTSLESGVEQIRNVLGL